MPNARPVPTVRRRRLGEALRQLRNTAGPDNAGLTLEEAAGLLAKLDTEAGREKSSWTSPKLSRIENAQAHIRPNEVTDVLTAYGVTDPEVYSALEGLAKHAGNKGWWQTYSGLVAPAYADYISLESDAERISEWAPQLIPGLLQTAAYARETIAVNATTRTPQEVTALAEVRMARQAVLSRPERPLTLWAVIHEAVLHQRFATRPTLMRDQLRRLLDAADLPNVTLQIMPLHAGPHPGTSGGFSLVGFPGLMPAVVLLENLVGASYVEAVDEVKIFANAFERILAAALPTDESLALIARLEESTRT
ncbi:helix-turn-helix transcriptional regulator [Streptomyces sp. B1866]|uniref:helix-turn-helix domain-containing protein n=1 Tax=Streptomyces sp. B1866 TaxID=3075431 RepID=UPI00288EF36D|nr:helix-turn-helix transcriptional regulator [Streptomyces sp. B1866]MDT3399830.1 helix-turn-helix transcriptional regulator [Streptomyces sp. B1866]